MLGRATASSPDEAVGPSWDHAHAGLADNPTLSAAHRAALFQGGGSSVLTTLLHRADVSTAECWAVVRRCAVSAPEPSLAPPRAPGARSPLTVQTPLLVRELATRLGTTPGARRRLLVGLLPALAPIYRQTLLVHLVDRAETPDEVARVARGVLRLWRREAPARSAVSGTGAAVSSVGGPFWLALAQRLTRDGLAGPGSRLATDWLDLGLDTDPALVERWIASDWPSSAWASPGGRRAAALVLSRAPRPLRQAILAHLGRRPEPAPSDPVTRPSVVAQHVVALQPGAAGVPGSVDALVAPPLRALRFR